MDCSPPGPSVHGMFQARVLEWIAIAFSVKYSLAELYTIDRLGQTEEVTFYS